MKLALYLTACYPSAHRFSEFVSAGCSAGIDRLEIGIPVREPKYDGPEIRRTHSRAMEEFSMNILRESISECLRRKIPTTALGYMPDTDDFGRFLRAIHEAGMREMIIPDLLIDYYDRRFEIIRQMKSEGVEWIPFYNPATPDSVIQETIEFAGGWVYYGLLPSTGIMVPTSLDSVYERAREIIGDREIVFGFGIRDGKQVTRLMELGADGIAIGSALVHFLEYNDVAGFRRYLEGLNAIRN